MSKKKGLRSPRFLVPNSEEALMSVDGEQFKGILHVLSLTGGTIRWHKRFAPGTLAELRMKTVSGPFSAAVQLLHAANSNTQAFRFIAMGPVARSRLEDGLSKMRAQGFAVEKTPFDHFRSLARRVLFRRSD